MLKGGVSQFMFHRYKIVGFRFTTLRVLDRCKESALSRANVFSRLMCPGCEPIYLQDLIDRIWLEY